MSADTIVVAGSANMDIRLCVPRMPQAGENIIAREQVCGLGGKGANRAVACARLGGRVVFSCRLGQDDFGKAMLERYAAEGIRVEAVSFDSDAPTGTAYILVEENGANRIIVNGGANFRYGEEAAGLLEPYLRQAGALSLELEIPLAATERLIAMGIKHQLPVIVDAGPIREGIDLAMFKGVYLLSPNESEAHTLTGIVPDTIPAAEEACAKLYASGAKNVLLKLGGRGALLYDGRAFDYAPAVDVAPVVDTTGAGDAFMAALTLGLIKGHTLQESMRFANLVAAVAVSRAGTIEAFPYERELAPHLHLLARTTGKEQ